MSEPVNDDERSWTTDDKDGMDAPNQDDVVGELRRIIANPLSPRQVKSFKTLPNLPGVRAVLPPAPGPTRTVRAIVAVLAEAIGLIDGQTVRLKGMAPLHLDEASLQNAVGSLLGITELGQTDFSPAPTRRAHAAEALGFSLENLGGDKGFRTNHEPVLLAVLAARECAHLIWPHC